MFGESLRNVQTPPTIIEEEEVQKKPNRPSNLPGISIIDTKWVDSDSDESLPAGDYVASSVTTERFCKSVDFRPLRRNQDSSSANTTPSTPTLKNPPNPPKNNIPMASGGSRFKVVPVETRYKRDRWQCHDFYDNRDPFLTRVPKPTHQTPAAALKKEEIVNRSSRSLSDIHPMPAVVQQKQPPAPLPRPVYIAPKPLVKQTSVHAHSNGSHTQAVAAGKQGSGGSSTDIMTGLEKSLTNTETRRTKSIISSMWNCAVIECNHVPRYSPSYGISRGCSPLSSRQSPSYSVAASPAVHPALNIDSKIEQAMDLVKTHLMFAVREEVDGLRHKIFDLENHVHKLEAENAILKRSLPNEVLQKLHLKP
ncbi:unnamed protein product [Caenorhabditis bovis]|uniref:Uncharacterized protein n=1 Tax=Caenorhabditis bovis TaxID=2654633 RepID=A0A8S1EK95_9PELO|nr:unnamed protein product [Caenorhabditis bovis]